MASIFFLCSLLNRSEARFASARAYLLLRAASFAAAVFMTAIGKEEISTSSFWCCWVIDPRSMASSIRCWARSRMDLYSGLVSSWMSMSNFWIYSVAWGVKGYLARSCVARTARLLRLFYLYAGRQIVGQFAFFWLLEVYSDGHVRGEFDGCQFGGC